MKPRIFRTAAVIAITVVMCILMNAAAPLIDTPGMRQNAAQGVSILRDQYPLPEMVGGFMSAKLDNYTAVLMIKTAAYTGEETWLHKAFGGLRTDMPTQPGQTDWEAYCTYADGSLSPTQGLSYTRYWHGYTLPLRLLLCVLNLANIQMLLFFVQLALMASILLLMMRRGLQSAIPGFFTAYFLLMPFALGVCLQFATASLPMLAACIAVLLWDEKLDTLIGMPAFFAVVGILTNYVDLLTYPLVTLGFPLVLFLALRMKRGDSLFQLLFLSIACCAGWGIGFGGMWALKWLITAACFGWDRLHTIISQIFLRVSTDSNGRSFSRMDAVNVNLSVIMSKSSYLLLLGMTGLASAAPALLTAWRRRTLCIDLRALALLIPAAIPFFWYFVMANHSVDHAYYTYRILPVACFAVFTLIAYLPDIKADPPYPSES